MRWPARACWMVLCACQHAHQPIHPLLSDISRAVSRDEPNFSFTDYRSAQHIDYMLQPVTEPSCPALWALCWWNCRCWKTLVLGMVRQAANHKGRMARFTEVKYDLCWCHVLGSTLHKYLHDHHPGQKTTSRLLLGLVITSIKQLQHWKHQQSTEKMQMLFLQVLVLAQ